jgi:hypothetical protein
MMLAGMGRIKRWVASAATGAAIRLRRKNPAGDFVEPAERILRSWPVAAAMLLATATVLVGTGLLVR